MHHRLPSSARERPARRPRLTALPSDSDRSTYDSPEGRRPSGAGPASHRTHPLDGSGPSPPPASLACPRACHLPPETPRSPRAGQGPCSSSTPPAPVGLCQGAGRSLKRLARSPTVRPWARHLHPGTLPLLSPAGPGSGTLVPCAPPFPAHGPSGHPSCAVPPPPRVSCRPGSSGHYEALRPCPSPLGAGGSRSAQQHVVGRPGPPARVRATTRHGLNRVLSKSTCF